MQIEHIPELALTGHDDQQIADLLDTAFGRAGPSGFDGQSYYQQRHQLRIITRAGEAIIGHIALLFRAIRVGGRLVQITGLAEVATHPDHAGRGIASFLLKDAVAQSRNSLAEFMVLFGDHSIYAKHGFQSVSNPLRYVAMDDCKTHDVTTQIDDALMVLPLGDAVWDPQAEVDLLGHKF
jgi:predicted N-acetyltransferase YhbS